MEAKIEYFSGAGNIFSVLDNRNNLIKDELLADVAQKSCKKISPFTMNTEGFIVVSNNESTEIQNSFLVKFFNPDGSTGMMCGNGARCAVKFAEMLNLINKTDSKQPVRFELAGTEYLAYINNDLISVRFPRPRNYKPNLKIPFQEYVILADFVDVGTPHLLFKYEEIPNSKKFVFRFYPIDDFAMPIRYNELRFPEGVNVSIYSIENRSRVHIRTYERGVEHETGACGTGAISLAYNLYKKGLVNTHIEVIPTSKNSLFVDIIINEENEVIGFTLTGNAEKIGEALIQI